MPEGLSKLRYPAGLLGEPDYFAMRRQFYDAVREIADDGTLSVDPVHSFPVPGHKDLSIDLAVFGNPARKNVLLIWANRHGGEYGACYANIAFIKAAPQLAEKYPNVTFAVFHTNNPYGFVKGTRVDHDGINPARNYVYGAPAPTSDVYHALRNTLISPRLSGFEFLKARFNQAKAFVLHYNQKEHFTAGTADERYRGDPNFMGAALPDNSDVEKCFARQVDEQILSTLFAGAENIIALDPHSGLGRRGETILMLPPHLSEQQVAVAKAVWQGFPFMNLGDSAKESFVSLGDPLECFRHLPIGKTANVISACIETGAEPALWAFMAQIHRSAVHQFARDNARLERSAAQFMRNTHTIPNRQYLQSLLNDHWQVYLAAADALNNGLTMPRSAPASARRDHRPA